MRRARARGELELEASSSSRRARAQGELELEASEARARGKLDLEASSSSRRARARGKLELGAPLELEYLENLDNPMDLAGNSYMHTAACVGRVFPGTSHLPTYTVPAPQPLLRKQPPVPLYKQLFTVFTRFRCTWGGCLLRGVFGGLLTQRPFDILSQREIVQYVSGVE